MNSPSASREEHLKLVSVIREWHETIRKRFNNSGEDAWDECCQDAEHLQAYSKAMHRLATEIWETNNSFTRIDWCNKVAIIYFFDGQLKKFLTNERDLCHQCASIPSELIPLSLLDVGSCYNAFEAFKNLYHTIVPLDLWPATEDVHQCDFLKLIINLDEINDTLAVSSLPKTITHLQNNSFSIVVFSLLLEYLPTPRHRWTCCEKAYQLLKPEGLLLIITPDSKHQNRNAAMIKSWKLALQTLGFIRIKYEKLPHLHCMAFRKRQKCEKCVWKKKIDFNEMIPENVDNMIYIPQDSRDWGETEILLARENDESLREGFTELPFNINP